MKPEVFEKFLTERYENQISWYSNRASSYKRLYQLFQWGVIILSATVPVLISSLSEEYKLIATIVSIILAIGTAGLKTFKFQENWINYRTVSETLKKEKNFYDADLDDYGESDDKEALFVERVEALISRENSLWVTTHKHKKDSDK